MRLEHVEKSLSDALDQSREQVAELRAKVAEATSNSHFHEHRTGTLEAALKSAQQAYETASNRRAEIEGLLVSQQREVHAREETIMQLNDSLRAAQERTRQAEVEAEVSKLSEERLIAQQAELREELKKQSALSESVYRIESSLANRMQEEREELKKEVDSLQHTLDKVRREHSETVMMHEQKIQTQEEELRILRGSLEQRAESISSLREDIARERGLTETAQERAAVMEKQLAIAQDRLSAIQGVHTADSILAAENAQREVELDQARSECEALRAQLIVAEKHADQYRKISASTEGLLKDLRERSSATRAAHEEEIASLKGELETLKSDLSERRESLMESVKEAEEAREALSEATKKHDEELAVMRSELEMAKEGQARAEEQMEVLKSDTAVFEAAAKEATSNYERELTMHAQVAAQLRKVEANLESVQSDLSSTKQKMAELSATCIRAEKALEDEKTRSKTTQESLREEVAALRHTNDLLHSQVQTMSSQVSRLENDRMRKVGGDSDNKEDEVTAASSEEASDELIEMRQASAELRDVVRYMKRERDMLEAKLSLTETEKNRYIAESTSTQKALDEARAELKREIESRSQNARSEDEFGKLMQEITQLNVVRESNAHLRSENVQLKSGKEELQRSLASAREQLKPLGEKVIRLEATLQSMETEKAALVSDAAYWKDRLHQLVSRYNDVDPEEHRELKEKLQQTEAEVALLREQAASSQSSLDDTKKSLVDTEASLAERVNELTASRSTAEIMEKNSENLRAKLRVFAQQIKDLRQQNGELNAAVKQKQEEVEKAQNDAKIAVASAPAIAESAPVVHPPPPAAAASTGPTIVRKATPAPPPPATPAPTIAAPAAVTPAPTDSTAAAADNAEGAAPSSTASDLKSLRDDLLRRMAETRKKKGAPGTTAPAPAVEASAANATKHAAPEDEEGEAPNAKRARTHIESAAAAAPVAPPAAATPAAAPPAEVTPKKCYFFSTAKGCRKGDKCPFVHEVEPAPVAPVPIPAPVVAPPPVVEMASPVVEETATAVVDIAESSEAAADAGDLMEEAPSSPTEQEEEEGTGLGEGEEEAEALDLEDAAAEEEQGEEEEEEEEEEEGGESAAPTPFSADAEGSVTETEEAPAAAAPVSAPVLPKFGAFGAGANKASAPGPFSAGLKAGAGAAGGGIFGSGLKSSIGAGTGAPGAGSSTNLFQAFAAKKAAAGLPVQSSPFAAKPLNPFAVSFSPHKSAAAAAPAESVSSTVSKDDTTDAEVGGVEREKPLSVSVSAANAAEGAAPSASPFMNLRPPSPSSSNVRIQFGNGNKSLPVPANVPAPSPTAGAGLFNKSFSGGSLFGKAPPGSSPAASPAPSPANVPSSVTTTITAPAGDLSAAGQPVRAMPLFSSMRKASAPASSPSISAAPVAATWSQTSTQSQPEDVEEPVEGEATGEEQGEDTAAAGAATIVSTTVRYR
jgi:nucleoprotein TPR